MKQEERIKTIEKENKGIPVLLYLDETIE